MIIRTTPRTPPSHQGFVASSKLRKLDNIAGNSQNTKELPWWAILGAYRKLRSGHLRGASCLFAHSPDGLRAVPDFSCTRVCPSLIETGFCNNQQCKFAHNKEQLRHRKPTDVELEAKKSRKGSSPSQMKKSKHHSSQKKDEVQAEVQVSYSKPVFLSNACMADEEEDDLLSICCDEPSWSRQTTEDLDLDIGELSRQVSTDSESEAWPTIEEVEANAKLVAAIEEPAPVVEKAERHWEHHVLLPEVECCDISVEPKIGFGKRGLLEKGSFQKSPFPRGSRECRDSRDFIE